MNDSIVEEKVELALLPLADGRRVALPLTLLAEVRQISLKDREAGDLGELSWRGHKLPISSLEELCGLPAPAPELHMTVGVFRASQDADQPFRAIAFCGLASHDLVTEEKLEVAADLPAEGNFSAAAEVDGTTYLMPDLAALAYNIDEEQRLH